MNFDIGRDNELREHLSQFDCDCEEGECCYVCDPAESSLRQEEEKSELRSDE
jgi:hypothetical protein